MADRCDVEVIVKLGGCAVTQKNTFETVKHDAILAAAKLVKQINGKCIVIHGAGGKVLLNCSIAIYMHQKRRILWF